MVEHIFPYSATTHGVTVRVQPEYLASESLPERGLWVWRYHVRIENHSDGQVQLFDRHWIIRDAAGEIEEVSGPGVVGEQPVIMPGGAHDYVSGCPLPTPSGTMEGSYGMVGAGGRVFRVAIPTFDLVSPDSRRAAN